MICSVHYYWGTSNLNEFLEESRVLQDLCDLSMDAIFEKVVETKGFEEVALGYVRPDSPSPILDYDPMKLEMTLNFGDYFDPYERWTFDGFEDGVKVYHVVDAVKTRFMNYMFPRSRNDFLDFIVRTVRSEDRYDRNSDDMIIFKSRIMLFQTYDFISALMDHHDLLGDSGIIR